MYYLINDSVLARNSHVALTGRGTIFSIVSAIPNKLGNSAMVVSKTQDESFSEPIILKPNTKYNYLITGHKDELVAPMDKDDILLYTKKRDYEILFPDTVKPKVQDGKLGEATINALAKFSDIDDLKYYELTEEDISRGYIWLPITKEKLNTHTNIHSFQEVKQDLINNEIGKKFAAKPQSLEEAAKATAKAMSNIKESFGTTIKPSYYGPEGMQPKDYVRVHELSGNILNVIKYITRAGKKNEEKHLEDLRKASKYLDDEIDEVINGKGISWWNKTWAKRKKK